MTSELSLGLRSGNQHLSESDVFTEKGPDSCFVVPLGLKTCFKANMPTFGLLLMGQLHGLNCGIPDYSTEHNK